MGVVPFNSYNQVSDILATQGEIGTYGDLALALENNPGWRVIDGGKQITNPVVTGADKVVPITNYIKTAPELEGGVVGATEMVEVTEAAGGTGVVAATNGLSAAWTVATVVTAVLQGVGLGIKAYELAPEFWTGVSNALFGTDIAYEDIEGYSIIGTIKEELFGTEEQNTTYLPYNTVQTILNYCAEYGLFDVQLEKQFDDNYSVGRRYNFPRSNNWQSVLLNGLSLWSSMGANAVYVGQSAYNLFLQYIGDLFSAISSYIHPDDVIMFNIDRARSGNTLQRLDMDVIIGTLRNPNLSLNVFNVQYANGNIIGYLLGPSDYYYIDNLMSSSKKFEYYADMWGNHAVTPNSGGMPLYGLCGCRTKYDGAVIEGSNLGVDFKEIRPDSIYTLPDNPTIYDPTKPFPQQYPDWYNRLINTNGIKLPYDDPSLYPIPWIPVTMPEYDPITQPEKYPAPGTSPEPSPYPAQEPQPWAQRGRMPEIIPTPYPDPNPKDVKNPRTGDDDPIDDNPPTNPTPTPPIVFPTVGGEANAIFTVYKPVLAELNSLAGVLWSSNFLENLIKIFTNNPMDAIISLHMLYATPSVGGRQNIKLGCYDSGIASDVVNKQYLEIDCGTVKIPEYFGDVRDYVNSVVDVYLPFVGMRHLKTQDIVGSYVTIKAGVDVFTGTILYTINIRKTSGINQIMYAYEGNCAVALPLTGADKSRMFSVLGAAVTGGAIGGVGGALVGAFTSMMNGSQQADIQRTGNFGANSGAMGVKKPYIVVSRNTPYDARSYSHYHGYPANMTVQLGDCAGFTRVLDCRVDGISGATDTEKRMIEEALKRGVII